MRSSKKLGSAKDVGTPCEPIPVKVHPDLSAYVADVAVRKVVPVEGLVNDLIEMGVRAHLAEEGYDDEAVDQFVRKLKKDKKCDWPSIAKEPKKKKQVVEWSRWFYGTTHLVVKRGDFSQDVATISRFEDGSCTLWIYNSRQKNLWTDESGKSYQKTVAAAMRIACRRFDVKGVPPTDGMPYRHPSNPV